MNKVRKVIKTAGQAAKKRVVRSKETTAEPVPRITNDTVAEHREQILSSARKYIYPLQHSKRRIVAVSIVLFIVATVTFFTYSILALYRFHSTSSFIYRVTQVIPFPIAKASSDFVAYENYLFEVRRYKHYYETQQKVDFSSRSGKNQLVVFEKQALNDVINQAYIKQLARKNKVSVSGQEVNRQVALLRNQNRLGGNDEVFKNVLKEFWGWSVADFKRQLKQEILVQKVMSKLDAEAHSRAEAVLAQLRGGADFAALAKQQSDDVTTKDRGGDYGFAIEKSNRDISPQVADVLFTLKTGQISDIIDTGEGLEIVKLTEQDGSKVKAAHIVFNLKKIDGYVGQLKSAHSPKKFVNP